MSQLFGMDNILSSLTGKYETKGSKETSKTINGTNSIGNPKLSDTASKYYEELKTKYSDMEFVVVSDDQIETAKSQASNIASDKSMIVIISESELEEMAVNEETRTKNEKLIEDAKAQMPDMLEKLKSSGAEVNSFGIEIKDGILSYFAVLDKTTAAQKERIEASAGSLEELLKKIQDTIFESKADNIQTPQEKMIGQSFDLSI